MAIVILTFLLPTLVFSSDTLNVLFSKTIGSENYSKYCLYIKQNYPKINCINAYGSELEEIASILPKIDGLVLTGGPDVNPKYYGKDHDSLLCEIDDYRDTLEFLLIDYAFQKQIPIFAICRGAQILNVYLGGTLYADLPTYLPSEIVHRCNNSTENCLHPIYLDTNSYFYSWIGKDTIIVNSYHHQGVEKLGRGLKPVAFSPDGLVEAYEWDNSQNRPFIIAVQWHPERLGNENQVSKILAEKFINKIIEHKARKSKRIE